MPKPGFFIVGAPKCGTTALCKYLNRHPEIFVPQLKELHYFDTDLKTSRKANSLEDYLALFAGGEGLLCGEGSPTYLYSETAAQAIHAFNPDAKIIIMLREPVAMMYSLHSQHLFNGNSETVQDFAAAIALEAERKQYKQVPKRCQEPKILFYREMASYSRQVERYFKIFGRDQVRIILFDDLKADTDRIFRETLTFLGVDPNFSTQLQTINPNKKVRSPWLQTLVKYPPARLLSIGKYLVPLPQSTRRALLEGVKAKLKKANTQQVARRSLDPALAKQLKVEFKPEVERLSKLLERDLSAWSASQVG